jgi:redox-sensitive bicupin YhaK (pirin superfamily)
MTWTLTSTTQTSHSDPVRAVLIPRARDLGDFEVRRALPGSDPRTVGPFVFFDQMGPVAFAAGKGMDVRPHPHIGLSTITWLFQGEIQHKDSLGYDVTIRPGEVNWMTAGSGIVHSERSPAWARQGGATLAGIQAWVALPKDQEECQPSFQHYTADLFPRMDDKGLGLALIVGSAFGKRSPVKTASETLYAELKLKAGIQFFVPALAEEQAIYVAQGEITLAGVKYANGTMVVLKQGADAVITANTDACCMLLGGDALDAPRHLYWNFVSSSLDRIEQAKEDWRQQRFAMVAGDHEFIPLPT